ncbi:MAG: DUF1294 domain-containing protein [Anaerolineales bacterium]|nr:DUF1294 domain-containing protein [Anaerolineales bacterium]
MILIYYFMAISLITFLGWGYDKLQAKIGGRRIPERALFGLILAGGAFGALAGMQLFRHKTRKSPFPILVPVACVLHAAIYWLLS